MSNAVLPKPGTRKVTVGALAGAFVTLVAYVLSKNGVTLGQKVFGAASTLLTAFVVYMTNETYT